MCVCVCVCVCMHVAYMQVHMQIERKISHQPSNLTQPRSSRAQLALAFSSSVQRLGVSPLPSSSDAVALHMGGRDARVGDNTNGLAQGQCSAMRQVPVVLLNVLDLGAETLGQHGHSVIWLHLSDALPQRQLVTIITALHHSLGSVSRAHAPSPFGLGLRFRVRTLNLSVSLKPRRVQARVQAYARVNDIESLVIAMRSASRTSGQCSSGLPQALTRPQHCPRTTMTQIASWHDRRFHYPTDPTCNKLLHQTALTRARQATIT